MEEVLMPDGSMETAELMSTADGERRYRFTPEKARRYGAPGMVINGTHTVLLSANVGLGDSLERRVAWDPQFEEPDPDCVADE